MHPSSERNSGRMTALMRAYGVASGPRVLRVGVVVDGKMIDERTLVRGEDATVGPTERATFVVPHASLAREVRLFRANGDGWELEVVGGMTGRLATEGGAIDLSTRRTAPLPLADGTRGRVTIGGTTFLFQLAPEPRPHAKAVLPTSVRFGNEVDWTFTTIAAFSFLGHFAAVGVTYGDWMDRPEREADVAGLVESLQRTPPPPPLERQEDPKSKSEDPAKPIAKVDAPRAPRAPSAGPQTPRGPMGDAQAMSIAARMELLDLQTIGALKPGGATQNVLDGGSHVPTGLLDAAAKGPLGVGGTIAGLNIPGGGFTLRPGQQGLDTIGNKQVVLGDVQGKIEKPKGPTGQVQINVQKPPPDIIPDPGPTVYGMQGAFRRCYEKGLRDEDPNMRGSLRVTTSIGAAGEVLSANGSGSGLSSTVQQCILARVRSATFPVPTSGGATVVIPITLTH